jgi:hypothetical protein
MLEEEKYEKILSNRPSSPCLPAGRLFQRGTNEEDGRRK